MNWITRLHDNLIERLWRYREWRRSLSIAWHPERLLVLRWTSAPVDGTNKQLQQLTGKDGDLLYQWGEGCSSKDGALLHSVFNYGRFDGVTKTFSPSLLEELAARGYDLTTLQLSV